MRAEGPVLIYGLWPRARDARGDRRRAAHRVCGGMGSPCLLALTRADRNATELEPFPLIFHRLRTPGIRGDGLDDASRRDLVMSGGYTLGYLDFVRLLGRVLM